MQEILQAARTRNRMDLCIKTPIGKVQEEIHLESKTPYRCRIKTPIGKVQEQQILLLNTV